MARLIHPLSPVIAFIFLIFVALLSRVMHAAAQSGPQPPTRYWVSLPAADRAARTALAEAGVAIDAIGKHSVVTIVDADGLARLHAQRLTPLSIAPLDFPPADGAYHNYA